MAGDCAPSSTVVICTRHRPALLERCLAAVACLTHPAFDVLVVDNSPGDGETRAAAERHGARYIVEPAPGLSRARNRGARAARGEIVAYLDDDSIPEADWLTHLASEFGDPRVMAVAGRILPTAATVAPELRPLRQTLDCGPDRRVLDRAVPRWFDLANFGGVGDGGNMALRRRAFALWPGFHERLGRGARVSGGEEHHAFFSLVERGYRVVYTPLAVVRHPFPETWPACRARLLRDRAAAAGYMAFLLVEEPRYRLHVLRYLLEWLRGRRRAWRASPMPPGLRLAPRWRLGTASLAGALDYACGRLAGRRSGEQRKPAPGAASVVTPSP